MIYLPTRLLKPGMILARDVPSANPILSLMVTGQTLDTRSIQKVEARGIKGLYVAFDGLDDIEFQEFLDPSERQKMLSDIKNMFDKVEKHDALPDFQSVSRMAESLVLNVLHHDMLLCSISDIRDYDGYTYAHSLSVAIMSVKLGRQLKLAPLRLNELAAAGLLHDIGKLEIPHQIIDKNGPLSDEEYNMVKEHPDRGEQRLRHVPGCNPAIIRGVSTHHEYYNGGGYTKGLEGERIPLYGRILAIADVFDALSSNRSYRKAWSPSKVVDYLTSRAGTQFDPELLPSFLNCVIAYPPGMLVKLSDDSVGVIIKNHQGLPLRPVIRLLAPEARKGQELDLASQGLHITVLDMVGDPAEASSLRLSPDAKNNG